VVQWLLLPPGVPEYDAVGLCSLKTLLEGKPARSQATLLDSDNLRSCPPVR
jgi:hypothetical protein